MNVLADTLLDKTFAVEVTAPVKTPAVAPMLPTLALPDTVNVPSVPTLVKLDVTTVELSVVPDNVPAGATTATLDAAVN